MGRNARDYYEYYFGREKRVSRIIRILEAACNDNGAKGDKQCDGSSDGATDCLERGTAKQAGLWDRIVSPFRAILGAKR